MNIVEEVKKEIKQLPDNLVLEALDFIKFLKLKNNLKNIPETMLLSEKNLSKDWLKPEEDEAWKNL